MALSQKHYGKMRVPWFNSEEWRYVFNLIYDENSSKAEKQRALEKLQLWKARTPHLPSGVEGTYIILDAILLDTETMTDTSVRLLYGTTIMRFLNICGAGNARQNTLFHTAKRNDLPDWLVSLRHDVAHSQILPPLCMLNSALAYCLNWLKLKYWDKQNKTLRDFNAATKICHNRTIRIAIELYCQINLAQNLNKEFVELGDVIHLDPKMNEKFDEISDHIPFDEDNLIENVLSCLLERVTNLTAEQNSEDVEKLVCNAIVNNGSIFGFTSDATLTGKGVNVIPHSFLLIWSDLMTFLYSQDLLLAFIKRLLKCAGDSQILKQLRESASLWLAEIFKALMKTNGVYEKKTFKKGAQDRAALKSVVYKDSPLFKKFTDYDKFGKLLNDVKCSKMDILYNPHEYSHNFLKYAQQDISQLLNNIILAKISSVSVCEVIYIRKRMGPETDLCGTPDISSFSFLELCDHSQAYIEKAELYLRTYTTVEKYQVNEPYILQTVDDTNIPKEYIVRQLENEDSLMENEKNLQTEHLRSLVDDTLILANAESASSFNGEPSNRTEKRWRRLVDTSTFDHCPIGVLPSQCRESNPFLHV